MKNFSGFAGSVLLASLTVSSAAVAREMAPLHPQPLLAGELLSSVITCQGELATTPMVGLTVEAYIHSGVPGAGTETYSDPKGLVTQIHHTTNKAYRRDAESARVIGSVDSSGDLNITVNTQAFANCRDCYVLHVTNAGPGAGHIFTGTLKFAGETTMYPLECTPL